LGVDYAAPGIGVLIQEGTAPTASGIGQQCIHLRAFGRGIKPIDALRPRQVGLLGLNRPASLPQRRRRLLDRRFIRRDQYVAFIL
jgi:hypothetical protein